MNVSSLKSYKNLQNSFWSMLEVVLTPFIFFVSIPIFLEQLGPQQYGIWMFVNSVIVIMQAFNLGLNFSTYKHVSSAIQQEEKQQIQHTLNTNLSLTVLIFLLAILACGLLSASIYQFNWFLDDVNDKSTLITCLFIGTVVLFTKLSEQILYNVYRAFENFKYVTLISAVIKTLIVAGNIIIAYTTKSIVLILGYTALISVFGLWINYRLLHRFIPHYNFSFTLEKRLIRYEVNYSMFIWLQTIAVIMAYQGDRLLVSSLFGLTVLSYYAIVSTLFNHIHMALGSMTSWLFPQVVKNRADKAFIFDLYLNVRNISTILSILVLCVFCLLSKPLFTLWLGAENYVHIHDYLKWFSIFEFFFIFTLIPNNFLNASENEQFNLRMVLMFTGLNILGMLYGALVYNSTVAMLIGLALSTAVGMYIFHLFIDRRFAVVHRNPFALFLLFLPSVLGSGTAFFDTLSLKVVSFVLCLISIYLVFVRYQRTNFKILLQ